MFWAYEGESLGNRVEHLYLPRSGMIIALAVNSATAVNNDDLGTDLVGSVYQTPEKGVRARKLKRPPNTAHTGRGSAARPVLANLTAHRTVAGSVCAVGVASGCASRVLGRFRRGVPGDLRGDVTGSRASKSSATEAGDLGMVHIRSFP